MELWIRSQYGELLEKAKMIKVGTTDNGKTYSIIVNNDYVYADYKTKERALEVLDEIQNYILLPNTDNSAYIYEMPKE